MELPTTIEEYEKMINKNIVNIVQLKNKKMKITKGEKTFILDPNKYDLNTLMSLLDLKKINKIENKFQKFPKGISRANFIKLLKELLKKDQGTESDNNPFEELNLVYGLYKLFCEIDLNGDETMQWSEFTQFIIDRVEGENDSSDPNDTKVIREKEMLKYKRYMLSQKVRDYNIHKKNIISACFYSKLDKLFVIEYDSKIIKIYNPKNGKIDCNFDVEDYFQKKIIEEEKLKKNVYNKKNKFNVDTIKPITFSILSLTVNYMNILALCLSSNKICFFTFGIDLKGNLLYEMPTTILQKKTWYLKEHGIWVSSGRKNENDKFYYLYELDVEFEKNGNKIDVLYNKGHWHRSVFFENPGEGHNKDMGHREEILDVIEITKPLLILTACLDGKIRLFNLCDKEYLKVWSSHTGGVRCLAYNPFINSNGIILSSGFEYHINIFSTDLSIDDAYKGKLEGHYAPVVCVEFLNNSDMATSVDEEGVVKIWDTKQILCLQSIPPDKKNLIINGLLYIKQTNRFITYGNKLIFYDPKYKESEISKQAKDEVDGNYPIQTEFNHYYMSFYVITLKDIRIYSSKDGSISYVFKKFLDQERFDQDTKLRCFTFDYRNRLFYLGFSNGTVQQFNAGNGSLIKSVNEYETERDGISMTKTHHTKEVTSLFLYYNKPEEDKGDFVLITTGMDSLIHMYDENELQESYKIRSIYDSHKIGEKKNEILCLDFSRRYYLFATGSIDGLVCVWDFLTSKMDELCLIKSYKIRNAIALKFLDPYPVLAVAYTEGDVFLWAVKPNIKYKGECFFRLRNYNKTCFGSEVKFTHDEVTQLSFMTFDKHFIPTNQPTDKYDKEFIDSILKDNEIDIDKDLEENEEYNKEVEGESYSYLICGDKKGYLKIFDLTKIFKKYEIKIEGERDSSSSFNILKKEEIYAASMLKYKLSEDKTFKSPFFTCMYPHFIKYDEGLHQDEIVHISLIKSPFGIITTSKDRRIKILDEKCNLVGEMYTGISAPNPPISEWKFSVEWIKLRYDEITKFLNVVEEAQCDTTPFINVNRGQFEKEENEIIKKEEKPLSSSIFKTEPNLINKKRFKKIDVHKEKKVNINEDEMKNSESYEVTRLKEMKNEIDQLFAKHGERKGMNEMSRNIIDSVVEDKNILELFQAPILPKKSVNPVKPLPKINVNSNIMKHFNKEEEREKLFSEKFVKRGEDNIKNALILPLIRYEFKNNENVKFKTGETENILGYEYYNNSYKECVNLKPNNEVNNYVYKECTHLKPNRQSVDTLRQNYALMWNFVDEYGQNKKKAKFKKLNLHCDTEI